jgi:cobalamin biosynthesis protein CobD/CbiB
MQRSEQTELAPALSQLYNCPCDTKARPSSVARCNKAASSASAAGVLLGGQDIYRAQAEGRGYRAPNVHIMYRLTLKAPV